MCYGTAMTNTLPDLRLTIAEGMEALAMSLPWYVPTWGQMVEVNPKLDRMLAGAETLRWCAAREAPTIEELQAEVDSLEDLIVAIDKAIDGPGSPTKRLADIRNLVV